MSNERNREAQGNRLKDTIRQITYGGIIAAIVLIATMVFQLPIPTPVLKGYVNFGDGVIMASAMIMGPYAAISAAIGSALADLLSSYVVFAPATFLIKGLMGLTAGLLFKKYPDMKYPLIALVIMLCEIIMITGYFIFETFYYSLTNAGEGLFRGAMTAAIALPFNAIQGVAAILLGLAMMPVARRLRRNYGPDGKWLDRDHL
ncbi:MAG: ECF transporter S component [Eubacteriales bacterium]|nr:ECF transporter S component [Eubacteriales bacterium]MDD3197279.1 ECF transporter S component [Eubacteriales bacterium]MDD4682388.1 ECF transporter S component [Eubacteriales bacterium]